MQILTNFPSLIDQWLRYRFQTILVVCFLLWTPLLVIETLQIQHSCHPMIHWSGTLPAECQKTPSPPPQPNPPVPPQPPDKSKPIEVFKEHPDITGGVIGIGVGIGIGLTVTTAPLAVPVVVGAAVWFAIRTVL